MSEIPVLIEVVIMMIMVISEIVVVKMMVMVVLLCLAEVIFSWPGIKMAELFGASEVVFNVGSSV